MIPAGPSVGGSEHGGGAVPPAEPSGAPPDADHGHRHPGGGAGGAGERQGHAAQHGGRPASRPAKGQEQTRLGWSQADCFCLVFFVQTTLIIKKFCII